MLTKVEDYLRGIGCCSRCILIYSGESNAQKFSIDNGNENSVVNPIYENKLKCLELKEDVEDDIKSCTNFDITQYSSKRLKSFICVSCLGLLQFCDSNENIVKIADAVQNGDFQADSFSIGLSHPVCLAFRIHSVWAHLLKHFPALNSEPSRTNHMGVLKDVWRSIVGPKVGEVVNKRFISGQLVPFNLAIQADYADDESNCLILEKLDEKKFSIRRKQHRKFAEGIFTKQAVEETLKKVADEEFLRICPELPPSPRETVTYDRIECTHASLYFAGRYNKYSRELPQTPWLVEEDRRFDSSVQELICGPLNNQVKADGVKFSASGREDVDVRCLGQGRPFVVEFLNPRRICFSVEDLHSLQDRVNHSTTLVSIKYLQEVAKKATCNLKEGEEEKTKSYCALCFSRDPVTEEMLLRVKGTSDLTLEQLTPLRVAHRRPLSVRKRVVHTMRAESVDQHFFKLYMVTQAGTYIKEFVHGDFGRTNPHLGSILGVKCDIIALDVENVELDWPPPL